MFVPEMKHYAFSGMLNPHSFTTSQWQDNWKLACVENSSLVDDPIIQQPGFDLPCTTSLVTNKLLTD